MNAVFSANLGIFLVMQALAQVAMKIGSKGGEPLHGRRWWLGFVAANAVGAPSILFLKALYRAMPEAPNVVAVMTMAGSFIVTQLTFLLLFRERLSAWQWAGVGLLAAGAALASSGRGP